jgi:protocatechuate 3,4-dioxygenase beta subunit
MLGPFYEPGAPVRTSVGSGYVLSGAVLAANECKPIPNARIEFWLANPRGDYDDAHRATVIAGERKVSLGEQRARLLRWQATPHPRPRDSARL